MTTGTVFNMRDIQLVVYGPRYFIVQDVTDGQRLLHIHFEMDDLPPAKLQALAERWTDDLLNVIEAEAEERSQPHYI